jgi:3-oxoacyl-[acyl-carrier protein] reductase
VVDSISPVFRLDGKVAFVTGAASGIGAATATALARNGADVAVAYFAGDPYDIAPVAEAVEAEGRRALALECDVASRAAVDGAVDRVIAELGRLDIVVANAGIARVVPSVELDDERWAQLLDIDLTGVFRCFRAALPHMVERGSGRLLATSSIVGAFMGWAEHVHYTSAKGGVAGLVRGLALEVAANGITVNAIAPGVIESPQSADPVNSMGPELLRDFGPRVPVGRVGQPADVAALFAYLASDVAAYLTGQVLLIDGGVSLSLGY